MLKYEVGAENEGDDPHIPGIPQWAIHRTKPGFQQACPWSGALGSSMLQHLSIRRMNDGMRGGGGL